MSDEPENLTAEVDALRQAMLASLFMPKSRFEAFSVGVTFGQFIQALNDRQWRLSDILLGNLDAELRRADAPEPVTLALSKIRGILAGLDAS